VSGYHRCPKCASDHMMDGAYVAASHGTRVVVGVAEHPDHGRLGRPVSTQVHACVCGSCGFVELYANKPLELYDSYRKAERGAVHAR
jgi:predicted nucleic-acid-binding Zn-ribbon protein